MLATREHAHSNTLHVACTPCLCFVLSVCRYGAKASAEDVSRTKATMQQLPCAGA